MQPNNSPMKAGAATRGGNPSKAMTRKTTEQQSKAAAATRRGNPRKAATWERARYKSCSS